MSLLISSSKIKLSPVFFLLVFFIAGNSFAQMGGMGGMGGGLRGGGMGHGRGGSALQKEQERPMPPQINSDQILQKFSELHSELELNPKQDALWIPFEDNFQRYIEFLVKEKNSIPQFDARISGKIFIGRFVDSARNKFTLLENFESSSNQLIGVLTKEQQLRFDSKIQGILVKDLGRI